MARRSYSSMGKTRMCLCGYGTCTVRVLIWILTLMMTLPLNLTLPNTKLDVSLGLINICP